METTNQETTDSIPEKCNKCRHQGKASCNRCQYRDKHKQHYHHHHGLGTTVLAILLIIAGLTMLGHNLGWINNDVYRIIMSWPMILIAMGVLSFFKRQHIAGIIFVSIGSYFLLFRIIGIEGDQMRHYWPIMLVFIGITLIFRRHHHRHIRPWTRFRTCRHGDAKEKVEDGFVTLDVSFGSTKTIVMDPVFRGADIDCSFGSVSLDLKRTVLEAPETIIDIDISFGGAELRLPSSWYVVVQSNNSFGGCEDKRWLSGEIDYEHKLIIRGNLSFSGIEIKD
ncbi:MAG: cell wall-active antibiotics response protein [Tannerellaceae bacterium]|jgi:predicted membrane protein|nr:cell wall-active antibiotics response protein [Tannerellaceae bacterium]